MASKIKYFDRVVMLADLPGTAIKSGDVGVVVEIYGNHEGYEIEFFALDGSTISVETVPANFVKPVSGSMILHTRELAS